MPAGDHHLRAERLEGGFGGERLHLDITMRQPVLGRRAGGHTPSPRAEGAAIIARRHMRVAHQRARQKVRECAASRTHFEHARQSIALEDVDWSRAHTLAAGAHAHRNASSFRERTNHQSPLPVEVAPTLKAVQLDAGDGRFDTTGESDDELFAEQLVDTVGRVRRPKRPLSIRNEKWRLHGTTNETHRESCRCGRCRAR